MNIIKHPTHFACGTPLAVVKYKDIPEAYWRDYICAWRAKRNSDTPFGDGEPQVGKGGAYKDPNENPWVTIKPDTLVYIPAKYVVPQSNELGEVAP